MRKDYNLEKRKYVIGGFISLLVLIYVVRLFGLQVGDDKYKESADSNASPGDLSCPRSCL